MIHEKIDGINFEKLMNGELQESEFMTEAEDDSSSSENAENNNSEE